MVNGNSILKSKLVRLLLRYVTKKNKKGESIVKRELDKYFDGKNDFTLKERIERLPLVVLIKIAKSIFSIELKELDKVSNHLIKNGILNLSKSIVDNGVTYPLKLSSPLIVVWNFTNECNLRCKHCYQNAGKKRGDELTLQEQFDLADHLADNNVSIFAVSGGEPIMSKNFWPVAKRASQRMQVTIASNGTLLTKPMINKLAEHGVGAVEVSLDSVTPEIHDKFRGVKGTWKKAIQGIKNIVEDGRISAGVNYTVNRTNFHELRDAIKLCSELGVESFCAYNFIPTGRGKKNMEMDLTPEMREEMLDILYEAYSTEKKMVVLTTCPQLGRVCTEKSRGEKILLSHFVVKKDKGLSSLMKYIGGCGSGRALCAVQPNGDVTPCVFMPNLKIGNVREKPFIRIWRESPVIKNLSNRVAQDCYKRGCEYIEVCGGCRSRAYAYFNNIMAVDPGCIKNKDIWEKLKHGIELAVPVRRR